MRFMYLLKHFKTFHRQYCQDASNSHEPIKDAPTTANYDVNEKQLLILNIFTNINQKVCSGSQEDT